MASDLQRSGLEVATVHEQAIFGVVTGTSGELLRKTPEEWEKLVEDAIITAAAEDMLSQLYHPVERDSR